MDKNFHSFRGQENAADRALIRRCKKGDRAAFEQLFDRHREQLLKTLKKELPDNCPVDDAMQDIFVIFENAMS